MSGLLTETITVPASRVTLQGRLDTRLREREWRKQRNDKYPTSVSDGWLEGEIQALEAALARTPADGVAGTFNNPDRMRAWEEAGRRIQAEDDGIAGVAGTLCAGCTTPHACQNWPDRQRPCLRVGPDDFVEHTHPEYGPGFFCTPDVHARIVASGVAGTQGGEQQ